ncbi:MAG: TIGR02281 family clan AA aspartic protease [Robiginitomaculum sp.]|nr:TIGR02281 family clan AA aspartic protease [Robiginitomaculum sp.]
MRSTLGFFSIFALVVAGLLLLIKFFAPDTLQNEADQGRIVFLLLLLVLIGGGAFGASKAQIAVAIKQAITWLAIFMLVIVAYSFRDELGSITDRTYAELVPGEARELSSNDKPTGSLAVAIRKSDDGHFRANAKVNKTSVRFLVDTGASTIALSFNDAKRIGINMNELNYIININTASGQTLGAPVILDKVSVGKIVLRDVEAIVIKDGLSTSLLGMSFLGRLQKFEASRNQLILKK